MTSWRAFNDVSSYQTMGRSDNSTVSGMWELLKFLEKSREANAKAFGRSRLGPDVRQVVRNRTFNQVPWEVEPIGLHKTRGDSTCF